MGSRQAISTWSTRSAVLDRRAARRAGGFVLFYMGFFVTFAVGLLMLAIDWGRVQLAKTELMNATTSAARAALIDMAAGRTVATDSAVFYAGLNQVDGTSMLVNVTDVTVGTWDASTKTFTANTNSPNAVSVHGVRAASRGTAVPLTFGPAVGIQTCDVSCTAIASNANDVQVNIAAYFNNKGSMPDYAAYWPGSGIGHNGYGYSDTLINGLLTRGTSTYALSQATSNCVSAAGQTIPLPAGDYKSVVLIVGHAFGPASSTLMLNNTDGTHTIYTQTYSDWCNPLTTIVNENVCGTYAYRNTSSGGRNMRTNYLMSYEFPITSGSGVVSITLPVSANMNVFAVGLTPSASITVR